MRRAAHGVRGGIQGRAAGLLPYAVLVAAVLVLFHAVIFGDRVLLDPSPFRYDPWRCYAGAQDLESEMHQGDNLRSYLPREFDLWRSVRSGRFPLWNPHAFGGTPFLADPQTRVIYPVSLLLTAFDPVRSMGYDIAIHVFLAMLGMYLFMRALKGTMTGALVGGLAYGISSFFYTRFGHPTFIASAAWIPFFFYGFETAQASERKGTLLLAVFLALGFLAGFPQVFLFGVGSLVIYAVCMAGSSAVRRRWADACKDLRILVISAVLSLLCVSVTLIPFVELLRNSTGLGIEFEEMKRLYQTPPLLLFKSIFPDFFGNAVDRTDWRIVLGETQTIQVSLFQVYCGVGGFLAAIAGLVFIRKSRQMAAFLVLLVLSVGVAVSPQVLRAAYHFALASYSKIDRAAVVSCFALAAMAGLGFSMISGEAGTRRRKWVILTLVMSVILIAAVSAYFWVAGPSLLDKAAHKFTSLPEGIKMHPWNQMRSGKVFGWSSDPTGSWLAFEKAQMSKALAFTLISAALLVVCVSLPAHAGRLRRLAGAAFVVTLFVDLAVIAGAYFVNQPAYSFFEPDGVKYLRSVQGPNGQWRIQCINSVETSSYPYETAVLPPNLNQIFGIGSLQGTYTTVPAGQADFRKLRRDLFPRVRKGRERTDVFPPINMQLASLMSVRHLVDCASAPARSTSPVLEAIPQTGSDAQELALAQIGGDTRLALAQPLGTPVRVDFEAPNAVRIDLWLGFAAAGPAESSGAPGESLEVRVGCEGARGSAEYRGSYSMSSDGGRWHRISIDLASVGSGPCALVLEAACRQRGPSPGATVWWSGFDLVRGDCEVKESGDGYRLNLGTRPDGPTVLCLEVTSSCRQVPLTLASSDNHHDVRWVAFPEGMSSRRVTVGLEGKAGDWVEVRSDSVFRLGEAKQVFAVAEHVDFDLIYDRDMKIYENFAATEKGVCYDKAALTSDESGKGLILKFTASPNLADARCGSVNITSYLPEMIVIEAASDRPCYLLLQDTYFPGWKASVDGREAKIMRTDLGGRAVELPAGGHQVVLRFDPRSVKLGLAGSSLGIILLVAYGVIGSRGIRRRA